VSLIIDEHREYLGDPARLAAFREAIRERVRPGDVVVDLGAGTGILGLLACQAGAARVYAIERTGIIAVARQIAAANGFAGRIVHVHANSAAADLPERAHGIVTDQIGHFGFEAGLFELIADSRRFLRPGGWVIPAALDLILAPVEDAEIRDRLSFWTRPVQALDVSAAGEWARNTGYPKHLEPEQLLGAPETAARVETLDAPQDSIELRAVLPIERDGAFDGVGGWFSARLSPGVTLSNGPGAGDRLRRRNLVLPVSERVRVEPGDRVDVRVQIRPADLIVSWRVVISTRDGERRFRHSTLRGMLMTPDEVRRMSPSSIPRLTPRGVARQTVLELCDGHRELGAIEREVFERHRALFRSPAEASVFVAEVVSRYSE
jgi:ribosomal protein L11 methyltransferase PrmA